MGPAFGRSEVEGRLRPCRWLIWPRRRWPGSGRRVLHVSQPDLGSGVECLDGHLAVRRGWQAPSAMPRGPAIQGSGRDHDSKPWTLSNPSVKVKPRIWPDHMTGDPMFLGHRPDLAVTSPWQPIRRIGRPRIDAAASELFNVRVTLAATPSSDWREAFIQ